MMLRQPMALSAGIWKRILMAGSSPMHRRKLLLLVFLWTCLCLLLFRTSVFSPNRVEESRASTSDQQQDVMRKQVRAAVSAAPEESVRDQYHYNYVDSITFTSSPESLINKFNGKISSPQQQQQQQQVLQIGSSSSASRSSSGSEQQHSSRTSSGSTKKLTDNKVQNNELPVAIPGARCKYDYPLLFDLQFNNIHWQKLSVRDEQQSRSDGNASSSNAATYYLYNAYYDDRWRGGFPSVRLLAMIDRVEPPPTNCLLWSTKLNGDDSDNNKPEAMVTTASFVYAWYPKWGNYKDGILQPWIVTCPIAREHIGLVPDSVSLVAVPPPIQPPPSASTISTDPTDTNGAILELPAPNRKRRQASVDHEQPSIAMPPSLSSSSSPGTTIHSSSKVNNNYENGEQSTRPMEEVQYDCKSILPITNNLPIYNKRPEVKEKFAVCVKGLDFPHDDVSIRLVEWIEMLNLLGASKIFLYELDVHKNISKVMNYYQERGIVELSPLTLPGDQPNLPEYQHLYLKNKLTAKRQNELIPYNDCLYRNLYSYEYLALLDIDEIIMPLGKNQNWFDLMEQVETVSMAEQNYSRASYNVRNVYFFDDLSGPQGTTSTSSSSSLQNSDKNNENFDGHTDENIKEDPNEINTIDNSSENNRWSSGRDDEDRSSVDSLERGVPHYLHMMSHVYRSKNYTEPGQYVKCFHNTERVVSLHNHFPMNCFGQCTTYSIPVEFGHLQHYRKDCVGPLRQSCKNDFRVFTMRDTTIWKYKQRMIKRTTRVLHHLGLL